MKQKKLTIILIALAVILIGAVIYFVAVKKLTPAGSNNENLVNGDFKIYHSQKYDFNFEYPKQLLVRANSTDEDIAISESEDGMWVNEVRVQRNLANLSLDKIVKDQTAGKEATITDLTIDGQAAKLYSIKNYGDYGNSGAVMVVNNDRGTNIIFIYGDDSTPANKAQLAAIIASFKMSK